jgi:hypothetical protein
MIVKLFENLAKFKHFGVRVSNSVAFTKKLKVRR